MYQQLLKPILEDINASSKEILASSVLTRDGMALTTVAPDRFNEDQFAAQVSASVHIARTVVAEMITGNLDSILIDGEKGRVWMTPAGSEAILALLFSKAARVETVLPQARKAANDIESLAIGW